ncbi:MAG: hypothetical protein H0T53_13705 [Herpetosiphonaceae bacterium]|nr:hypothetical protein [Herpetosiphonaceae bacterium]
MSISFNQAYDLVCPTCNRPFTADTWVIVDAEERPDLALAVREITLHDTVCPHCGQTGMLSAPLLYHDRTARAVVFGVPRDMPEAEWRELAQGLLWMLIGALPRPQQLPYLGEVQAEDGLAGVAAALGQLRPVPLSAIDAIGDALGSDDPDELPPLAEAIMELLDAKSSADLDRVLNAYPFLLDAAMDEGLAGLAEAATDQGEFEIGQAFERARIVLTQLRQTLDRAAAQQAATTQPTPAEPVAPPPASWSAARRALLALEDSAGLADLLAAHPVLAESSADSWLAEDEQSLRDTGDLGQAQLVAEARALLRGERG